MRRVADWCDSAGGGAPRAVYTAAPTAAGQALQNNAFGARSECHTAALTGRTGAIAGTDHLTMETDVEIGRLRGPAY